MIFKNLNFPGKLGKCGHRPHSVVSSARFQLAFINKARHRAAAGAGPGERNDRVNLKGH